MNNNNLIQKKIALQGPKQRADMEIATLHCLRKLDMVQPL